MKPHQFEGRPGYRDCEQCHYPDRSYMHHAKPEGVAVDFQFVAEKAEGLISLGEAEALHSLLIYWLRDQGYGFDGGVSLILQWNPYEKVGVTPGYTVVEE